MPTIAFTTLGCRVNQYDTDSMRGLFAAAGYEEADFSGPADVYVINTCSVTHVGEKKSRQIIRLPNEIMPTALLLSRVVMLSYLPMYCQPFPAWMPLSGRTNESASFKLSNRYVTNEASGLSGRYMTLWEEMSLKKSLFIRRQ